jgi:hypothetical protein
VLDWWRSLQRPPEPLTRSQRLAAVAAALIAAVSRVFALARTPRDWDELLFMRALDHFDVAAHSPHPPGFPLFILAGKALRALGLSDFHALQSINFLAAIAIVPAMFWLCRELRMPPWSAIAAGLLLAFFPNVWVFGGGAFSDVPSMTLIVVALALLMAGCRSSTAYLAGAAVLAISVAVRPQNLVVGVAPFILASCFRHWRQIAAAIAVITIVDGASYGAAAWLTGWDAYRESLHEHQEYITRVDSFLSPKRPPLWRLFDDFFIRPYRMPVINVILALLVIAGLVRRRPAALVGLAAFGPLCFFSWLMLDHLSVSRFAIGYAPLMAILAADGAGIAGTLVVIIMIAWTWPALTELRSTISPPVAAMESLRSQSDPKSAVVYVDGGMVPFSEWYLGDYHLEFIRDAQPRATFGSARGFWLHERWGEPPHRRLWEIIRSRYYDVGVDRIAGPVAFGSGWYGEEQTGRQIWRWMGSHSEATLPPATSRTHLILHLYAPLDAMQGPPNVTIRINGAIVDRFQATTADIQREIAVHAFGDRPNVLTMDTDRVATTAGDPRVLGLRLNALVWTTGA